MFRSRHTFSMEKNHHRKTEKHASFSHPTGGAASDQEPKSDSDPATVPTPPPLPPSVPVATTTSPVPAPETPHAAEDDSEEVLQLAAIEEEKEKEEVDEIISSSADIDTNLIKLSEDVDQFLAGFSPSKEKEKENEEGGNENRPEIPDSVEKFAKLVQVEIVKCVSGDVSNKLFDASDEEQPLILDSIDRISKITKVLGEFQSEKEIVSLVNLTSTVLHRAMSFLEEEFRTLLDIPRFDSSSEVKSKKSDRSNSSDMNEKSKRGTISFTSFKDPERSVPQVPETVEQESFPGYSGETLAYLKKLAATMISSGYVTECFQIYNYARRNAFEDALNRLGFEKISIDDIQKMQWESLESEINTWVRVTKQAVHVYFPEERKICEQVFTDSQPVYAEIFNHLTTNILLQLLNFAQAVSMTKRSTEKLFKILDTYETVRDIMPKLDELFGDDTHNIKLETQSARSRLAEAAVSIFCDLENSIKSDVAKTPVPGGAVHPLTRYTVNYLNLACDYKDTLEQVFQENRSILSDEMSTPESSEEGQNSNQPEKRSPFAEELITVMDLLDSNLEAKSKLYKDLSLSYIFLMNNGRYILQKIKESVEIYNLLGNTWSRKKSTDLRQFHKNYQRETWSKVLDCLKDQGLLVNGKVLKPVLKERFKSFNAMFEEIHKTQTTWIVTDQQLQSELQVSISAVIIPAYRSFLARFQQTLDPGRQTEKYIKFGPEDIESQIGDLFSKRP